MHNDQALLGPSRSPRGGVRPGRAPAETIEAEASPQAALGFYLTIRPSGFAVHMSASQDHLRIVREMADKTLTAAGVAAEMTEAVQLVASDLIGNSVRACGDFVPLVVEVEADLDGVWVKVHDPDCRRLPVRTGMPSDGGAETGRGLPLVDLLSSGWQVALTPIGKQISAHLPYERHLRVLRSQAAAVSDDVRGEVKARCSSNSVRFWRQWWSWPRRRLRRLRWAPACQSPCSRRRR